MTIGRIPSVEGGIQPTIVDAKGDLIAGVAADSINRLAVGTNGTVLTADSSTSTGLAWTGVNQMANPIINGGFDIWQRGTSVAFGTVGGYGADRWIIQRGGWAGGATMSRQTGTSGLTYAARVQRDSGNTSTAGINIQTSVETLNSVPFQGQTVTLSFYARAGANFSSSGSVLGANLYTGTGTDQNNATTGFTGSVTAISQNATLTTSFQRFSYSATLASNTNEIGLMFNYNPVGTAGANDWFEVTGIQIDIGTYTASTAPTFRRSGGTIQGELQLAQRYYWRSTGSASSLYALFVPAGYFSSTTVFNANVLFPVTMRTTPTSVDFGNLTVQDNTAALFPITAITMDGNLDTPYGAGLVCTVTGATAQRTGRVLGDNSATAHLGFSAEL